MAADPETQKATDRYKKALEREDYVRRQTHDPKEHEKARQETMKSLLDLSERIHNPKKKK